MLETHVKNLYYAHGLQVSQVFFQHPKWFIMSVV